MNVKLRYKVIVIALGWAWFIYMAKYSKPMTPNVLPHGDTQQIIVDPIHHNITIVTPQGAHTTTLPDHPSTFDVHADGTVKVTAKQFGFEHIPFVGFGYGAGLSSTIGLDFLYWKRLDLSSALFIPIQAVRDTTIGLAVSYNIWDNLRLTVGIDHRQAVNVLLSVRI
jgi:hypothetical protein